MTSIAFYAPLKSPGHPTASGDRQIARNLVTALQHGLERPVHLASELRSFDAKGDAAHQALMHEKAQAEIARLTDTLPPIALWVSYHNYYKAPDLIGPHVARNKGVPYVVIEATRAKKRLDGPWAMFAAHAEAASDSARVIFCFTDQDRFALLRDQMDGQDIIDLPPFLNRTTMPPSSTGNGPMLAVGMMRPGDKLASYSVLAQALAQVNTPDWHIQIVGDGAARTEVETLFAPFGSRVTFLGAVSAEHLQQVYARSALFVWPGVNEAFGMVYLEAQAAGLPVVAQNRPGVCDVLAPGVYPSVEDGAQGLAKRIDHLLSNPQERHALGGAARTHVHSRHMLPAAAARLRTALAPLMDNAA